MSKLRLSEKERLRSGILLKVKSGGMTLAKGAELLSVSYRQMLRIHSRYLADGAAGLKHGLRDVASNHQITMSRRDRVLELYQGKYGDFGPTLASEYLLKHDGEKVGIETLRQWLVTAGLWSPRRRGAIHRQWRERKGHFGEMVQMDGSLHDWFEGRRGKASLMVMIDDATNWTYAQFYEEETTVAAMTVFRLYVGQYGLPHSLYVDRDAIYLTTRDSTVDEALSSTPPVTQFGRAMAKLNVKLICAHSPQAKGRVERRHGVFQNRLVKGMRLKKISTLEGANRYLDEEFLSAMNEQFSVEAREQTDVHRRVPQGTKLDHVLCFEEERVVQNDWTISWQNRHFQLREQHRKLSLSKKRIMVSERLDGTLRMTYRNRELLWDELTERPTRQRTKPTPEVTPKKPKYKPGADHPWKRSMGK